MNTSDQVESASYFMNRNKTILCVEDNPDDRTFIGMHFENTGFNLEFAPDAKTALKLLKENKYYAMTCDMNLPQGISGKDFFLQYKKELEEKGKEGEMPTTIILTGHPRLDDATELFGIGDGSLDKTAESAFAHKYYSVQAIYGGADALVYKEDLRREHKGRLADMINDINKLKRKKNFLVKEYLLIGNENEFMHESIDAIIDKERSMYSLAYFCRLDERLKNLTMPDFKNYLGRIVSDPTSVREELGIENILDTLAKNYVRVVGFENEAPVLKDIIKYFFPYVSVIENISRFSPKIVDSEMSKREAGCTGKIREMLKLYPPNEVPIIGGTAVGKSTTLEKAVEHMNPFGFQIPRYVELRPPRLFEVPGKEKVFVPKGYIERYVDDFALHCPHKGGTARIGVRKEDISKTLNILKKDAVIPVPHPEALMQLLDYLQNTMNVETNLNEINPTPKIIRITSNFDDVKKALEARGGWDDKTNNWERKKIDLNQVMDEERRIDEMQLPKGCSIQEIKIKHSKNPIAQLHESRKLAEMMHYERMGFSMDALAKDF